MLSRSWFEILLSRVLPAVSRRQRRASQRTRTVMRRLKVEALEDRRVLALASPVNYDTGTSPQAIVSADFNNDDILDLATANYSTSDVSVLLGNEDGTFQAAQSSPTGVNPHSVAVGDFNGDGILDLATANGDGNGNGEVSVLLGNSDSFGNGTGTFQSPAGVVVGSPTSVAVGDFNGDGNLDLGVTSVYYYYWYGNYSYANVLLGNGAGGFSGPNSTWLDWGYFSSASSANFNGDVSPSGHPIQDFVTVSYGTVYVLRGDASGTLQAPSSYWGTGSYPSSVAAKDVNGDLTADVVVANRYDGTVSVLLGDGGGNLATAKNYSVGSEPTSVAVGDFNHDTRPDIATANFGSNDISVLYGRSDDTFSPAINSPNPGGYALVAGDFDGDTWLDAATANVYTSNLSVLINDHAWPVAPPSLSIGNVTVTEGNTGTVTAEFIVTRSSDNLVDTVTVNYSTANGGALAVSDYIADAGTLTFEPGESTKSIFILVNGDLTDEYDQAFYINLADPSGALIADGFGVGTILDDDLPPAITITPIVSAKEGPNNKGTWFDFVVTLSAPSEKQVSVSFATADGTATSADSDYVAKSGTLTFAPGVTSLTIPVLVRGDKKRESNERFYVNLSGATNATIAAAQAVGEILDDDTPGGGKGKP